MMTPRQRTAMFSSLRVDWATPRRLFAEMDREFHFECDVCATAETAACPLFMNDGALEAKWTGMCWMNPPYGRKLGDWVSKAWHAARDKGCTVVSLLPARTDTIWFHEYCLRAKEIRFLKGRLEFDDAKGKRAPFPTMIVIFGEPKA